MVREPWPEECDAFIKNLHTMHRSEAARQATNPDRGETLTSSSFRRWAKDRPEFAAAVEDADRERKEARIVYVESKLVENVERAMQATPVVDREGNETGEWRYEGSVANKGLEMLGRTVGMFSDTTNVQVAGALEVRNPDIAASLERLNEILAAAAARAAVGDGAEVVPGGADGRAEGRPRLAVARVAGTAEPDRAAG